MAHRQRCAIAVLYLMKSLPNANFILFLLTMKMKFSFPDLFLKQHKTAFLLHITLCKKTQGTYFKT